MVLFLCLRPDGEVKELEKTLNPKFKLEDTLGLQYLKGVIENKGKGKIERLFIWNFQGYQIYIYGWKKGTEEQINSHSLPKPLHEDTFYGDFLCFLVSNGEIIDFNEGFYLDFFQNDWEEAVEEDELGSEMGEEDNDIENPEEDEGEEEPIQEIEIVVIEDELQIEPEYMGI